MTRFRATTGMRSIALAIAVAIAAAPGCEREGEDPYALWETYDHPDGAFHFHYLSPPWEKADDHARRHPVLVVVPSGGGDARLRLEAALTGEITEPAAADVERSALQDEGYEVEDPAAYESRAGDEGIMVRASGGSGWVIAVYQAGAEGVAGLEIRGFDDAVGPDDADIRLLVAGFEPRASGEE